MNIPKHFRASSRIAVLTVAMILLPVAGVLGGAPAAKRISRINPAGLTRFDYSSHVVATDVGPIAHIGGQSAMDVNMNIQGETLAEQLPTALRNFDLALAAVNAGREDVAQMTVFYVGKDEDSATRVTRAIRDYFAPGAPPAVTFVGVASLISPAMRVEVEGIAMVKAGG